LNSLTPALTGLLTALYVPIALNAHAPELTALTFLAALTALTPALAFQIALNALSPALIALTLLIALLH
jgi:hypothetical protein